MGVEGVTGQRTVNPLIVSIGDVSLLTHEGPALRLGSEEERSHIRVNTWVYELGDSFGPVHRHLQRATMALPSKAA